MQTDRKPLAGFGQMRSAAIAVALAVLFVGSADAQEGMAIDPSKIWYSAYRLIIEGEKAEEKGNLLLAAAKYRESKPLFDGLARQYPNFHPELVNFRREQLVDSLARLKSRMQQTNGSHLNAPPPPGFPPASSPASVNPNPSPQPDPGIVNQGSLTPASREFLPQGSAVPGGTPNHRENAAAPATHAGGVSLPEWQPLESSSPAPLPGSRPHQPAVVRPPGVDPAATQDLGQIHQSRVRWMQEEIDRLNRRNQSLENDLEQRQRYLESVQANLARANQEAAEREQQLKMASADPNLKAKADELERLLNEALDELEKSRQQNEVVFAELRKTRQELEAVRKEKEAVERERDELVATVDGGESATAIRNLMNENRQLRDKLAQAEATAKQLSQESHDKDVEISLLKDEIERIDARRKQLLEDNRRYDSHIAELQKRLRDLGQELSPEELENLASVSPKLVEENELLREVVLKQLRRQRQIQATKTLLLDGLDKLGNEAAELYALVEDLATGPAITPEERKMIRQPGVEELVAAESAVDAVNAVILVEGGDGQPGGEGILEVKKIDEELIQIQKVAQLDFRDGRFAEAEANYLKYLKFRPHNVVCICNLALVKLRTGKYDDAEGLLEKAIALKSDSGTAYYLLGRTHFEQGRFDEALSRLNEGLRYDPNNAKAHNCVGVISSQKGFANRAEQAFTQAVTLDPDYGDAHFNLAVLFATGDKPDANRAMTHYQKAVDLGIPPDAAIESFLERSLFTAAAVIH